MMRSQPYAWLLAVLLFGQAVGASWSHQHCHHDTAVAGHSHSHLSGEHHDHHAPDLPPIEIPGDEENCTLCRHLPESSLPVIETGLVVMGQLTIPIFEADTPIVSRDIVGLRRPRSPPQVA